MNKTEIICTTLLVEHSPQALPLGAACIASAIKHDPRTRDFCNVQLISFDPEEGDYYNHAATVEEAGSYIANTVVTALNAPSGVICFSVFVWNRLQLEAASRILRSKGYICIAGGPEVTANPNSFTDFDYLVTGPGEQKVPELISKLLHLSDSTANIPDLQNTTSLNNKTSAEFSIPHSPYLDQTLDPTPYGGVLWELARGCPFKCSYCYESKGEKTITRFSMERIKAELELFAKKKIPQVFVLDPTYNANKKQALELLKLIRQKTPNTFYYFEARGEFIDRELAHAFTQIPCALQIGLQSSDENVLRLVNRPFNRKQFLRGINFLNEEGVIFGFDLIYGLPGDTFKGFKQSVDFALSLYPNNLEIFRLSVLPGTDLADKAAELNLTSQTKPPYHIIHTDRFSVDDLTQAEKIATACSFFYNDGRAVPWFNTICNTLRLRPSAFLEAFSKYTQFSSAKKCSEHKEIEKIQLSFVQSLLAQKHMEKYSKLITDIILINGAISRTQDTGKSEKITLNYPAEYLDSQYATNLEYFIQNIKPHKNTISTYKDSNYTYWK